MNLTLTHNYALSFTSKTTKICFFELDFKKYPNAEIHKYQPFGIKLDLDGSMQGKQVVDFQVSLLQSYKEWFNVLTQAIKHSKAGPAQPNQNQVRVTYIF